MRGGASRSALVPRGELSSKDLVEALTVAMATAPGVYSRNRHFSLHETADAKLAKRRAALLRGILRHLAKACDLHVSAATEGRIVLRYRLIDLSFERKCELSATELACVRYLARRAGKTVPGAIEEDGATRDARVVEDAIARLGPRIAESP